MPRRVPTFKPPWLQPRKDDRPSASARGYCSSSWAETRKLVIARDGGVCQACGKLVSLEAGDCHVDHIIPKSQGGSEDLSNLQLLHRSCHSKKTARGS